MTTANLFTKGCHMIFTRTKKLMAKSKIRLATDPAEKATPTVAVVVMFDFAA